MVTADSDSPAYKLKRKAVSQAFFKSKMDLMIKFVKESAMRTFYDLQQQGDENVVDVNSYTSKVQAHIIVAMLIGSGYSYKTMQYRDLVTGETSQITVGEFMDKIMPDAMTRIKKNPLIMMNPNLMGMKFFNVDYLFHENMEQLRGFVKQVIEDKKQSADDNATDFITLLANNESY